ncbi:deoxyribonuclease [Paraoerskovia sediminicola]|uniref:Deoxyribonuclease n=1 Tax=Paraoerskovia sediminicola TaxID=1138587 RepID=A0ABM8G297_9CELL|nr:HNH endonuclease family protein [Paraoerskovia sediminicola]BDZ42227.1 deoxyribonuclease [Paraoerskovia sediminicola]
MLLAHTIATRCTVAGGPVYSVTAQMHATATAELGSLEVRAAESSTPVPPYDRDRFGPAWDDVDANGCDTRNDVLARDLTDVVLDATGAAEPPGCVVLAGVLLDPYGGATIRFERGPGSAAVQIDHVVALGDAWASGAALWSDEQRRRFANDPANLIAVDGPLNQEKGADAAAAWLPPNRGFRCVYALRQVRVKAAYRLTTTADERATLEAELARCRVRG